MRVRIPDGVVNVKPMPKPGWTVATVKEKLAKPLTLEHGRQLTETIREVSWSGGNLPDAYYDEFVFTGFLAADLQAGDLLHFAGSVRLTPNQVAALSIGSLTFDSGAGAFTLGACYHNFPPGTVHVVVVDPGVGSPRRAIVASAGGYFFVGPDNGVFSFVYARESNPRVFHVTNERYFRHPVSATFHGRDVFAPAAAHLALGLPLEKLGPPLAEPMRLSPPAARKLPDGTIVGEIVYVDGGFNTVVGGMAVLENSAQ